MTDAGPPAPRDGAAPRLGATLDGDRTVFRVATSVADKVELCLFDERGREERLAMSPVGADRWQLDVPGVGAGQRYGLRAHGPYDPDRAQWCEPTKLLLDPYAHAFDGAAREPRSALAPGSGVDTASLVPLSVVVDDRFDWGDDDVVRPRRSWDETVLYEAHVRGATARHPRVPVARRGTYLGLGDDAFVSHLLALGVTAVELLPVHELVDEGFLVDAGRSNYWGYNPIGYFAPAARYAASDGVGAQVGEFKAMVAALHRAGLEVLLDVVYNHTAEGDDLGPTLSFKGFDAPQYYRHDERLRLVDTTGCGNSINAASPLAAELVVDSLRYWVSTCHVDGFRFDLAPTLARPRGPFDPAAPILARCAADPVLAAARLICEPWDLDPDDGYALGRFPPPYREWNGRFRDTVRDFWRDADGDLAGLATCMAGSADLFEAPARTWTSSINLVTSHDGFTLRDLVSYEVKHNEANGHDNLDGTDDNRSWNCGVEGETDDPGVLALRGRQARALLATLLVSRGVPMLLGGDELGRTQGGNNNAYCQDNETSWLDWQGADEALAAFVARLVALRGAHPALRGDGAAPQRTPLAWRRPDGAPMAGPDWEAGAPPCLALHATAAIGDATDEVVVCVNGRLEVVEFALPGVDAAFVEALSSFDPSRRGAHHRGGGRVVVPERSVLVLVAAGAGD
ncbi:MAG TPA: glycogen debranching protein GlgX [Acidimicrobiales bacterium]|nr:glycogen debranching protein GlgX [Acidimicrobiales bacterium]